MSKDSKLVNSESQSLNADAQTSENGSPEISDHLGNDESKVRFDDEHQNEGEEGPGAEKKGGGESEEEEDGDDEVGECGFCLFMKGGACKDSFIAWEQCVEDADKNGEDIVEKCFEVTANLKKCMDAHSDYYEPVLRAEKKAEEEAVNLLEQEQKSHEQESKQNENGSDNSKGQADTKEA